MAKLDTIMIEGRTYSWRQLCVARRQQIEAQQAAQAKQLALFEMRKDCRPGSERTAAGRFLEPSLFSLPARRTDGLKVLLQPGLS
jgi:hypothetical protein